MSEAYPSRSARPATTPERARDARARAVIVHRYYRESEESCISALELLLKKSAVEGTNPDGDGAKKGSPKHEVRANGSIP